MSKVHDVLIIGGGPAGVIAGIGIAKEGYDVVIIDKKERGNIGKKNCGDALDTKHTNILFEELGIELPNLNNGEVRSEVSKITIASKSLDTKLTASAPAYQVDRLKYGQTLLETAEKNGVKIWDQCTVRGIIIENNSDLNVVAINDLGNYENLAYLLKHDSVMGILDSDVKVNGENLLVGDRVIKLTSIKDPAELPWSELNVDVVIESTGIFRDNESLNKHISAGAKKVLLTVPPKDEIDATIVLGVNDDDLKPDDKIVSNASCTTNCLAPIAKVLDDNFGIKSGLMTTVHAYTNDQALAETTHSDFRRGRSATQNIIPTSTGAAKAVGMVLPELNGKLDGMAMRVPVPDGSVVDLVVELEKSVSIDDVNKAVKQAADNELKGILEYSEVPLVSTDILNNPHSSIYDASSTQLLEGNHVKVVCWYDNEWGYSNRVVDLIGNLLNNG